MNVKRIPPSNENAESSVLGSILIDNKIFSDIIPILNENDFYFPANKLVFKTMTDLFNNNIPIDLITVSENIPETQLERIGGITYLSNMAMSVNTTIHAEHHAKIVSEKSVRRQLIIQGQKVIGDAYEGEYENAIDIKSSALETLATVMINDHRSNNSIASIVKEVNANIKKKIEQTSKHEEKYFTGIEAYDKWLDGLHEQELTIIGARPAVGKTSFGLQIARHLVKKGLHVVFVTLEMSGNQLVLRLISSESGINSQKLRKPKLLSKEEYKKYLDMSGDIEKWPLYIEEFKYVQDIRSFCRDLKSKDKLDALFIDYIQLMQTNKKTNTRNEEVGHVSRSLKSISKEFNIPVVALAQLSRETEKQGREPRLSDLKESGDIEQDRLSA